MAALARSLRFKEQLRRLLASGDVETARTEKMSDLVRHFQDHGVVRDRREGPGKPGL
jgi:hypothetical protein